MSLIVSNGQILSANGQPFIAKGINIYADVLMSVGAAAITSTFPGINFLRVNVYDMTTDTAALLAPYIDALTSRGVVVELEDHDFPAVLTGAALTAAVQRYTDWATVFKGNPNVVFGTQNEPEGSGAAIDTEISTIYNAIRATGNTNLIMMVPYEGYSAAGLSPSAFTGMTNVAWDVHYYSNLSDYSTSIAANQAALAAEVAGTQGITSANGAIPVIIGEYGPAAGDGIGPGGYQAVAAVQSSGFGAVAWAWETENPAPYPGDLVNPPWMGGAATLTPYGQAVAQFIEGGTAASPAMTTGSGSDSLVLGISEDAYQGNAQFTVSIDGKQLGGTFTATASHAAAANQNFAFNGDFGTGQHTVTVDFLNDLYGGSAAMDRNLYVDAVTYDGTVTGQSAALAATGPQSFTVSGGTAPSVNEIGNQGTLSTALSQLGTYAVGTDTFIIKRADTAAVTLGNGVSRIAFIGARAITLTGGSGQSIITADAGANQFIAGTGTINVTGGGGQDAYVFHAGSGFLDVEDFSTAKGDTLTVDKALQAAMQQTSDGQGGTLLSFGAGAGEGVDIHGMATMPASGIIWA